MIDFELVRKYENSTKQTVKATIKEAKKDFSMLFEFMHMQALNKDLSIEQCAALVAQGAEPTAYQAIGNLSLDEDIDNLGVTDVRLKCNEKDEHFKIFSDKNHYVSFYPLSASFTPEQAYSDSKDVALKLASAEVTITSDEQRKEFLPEFIRGQFNNLFVNDGKTNLKQLYLYLADTCISNSVNQNEIKKIDHYRELCAQMFAFGVGEASEVNLLADLEHSFKNFDLNVLKTLQNAVNNSINNIRISLAEKIIYEQSIKSPEQSVRASAQNQTADLGLSQNSGAGEPVRRGVLDERESGRSEVQSDHRASGISENTSEARSMDRSRASQLSSTERGYQENAAGPSISGETSGNTQSRTVVQSDQPETSGRVPDSDHVQISDFRGESNNLQSAVEMGHVQSHVASGQQGMDSLDSVQAQGSSDARMEISNADHLSRLRNNSRNDELTELSEQHSADLQSVSTERVGNGSHDATGNVSSDEPDRNGDRSETGDVHVSSGSSNKSDESANIGERELRSDGDQGNDQERLRESSRDLSGGDGGSNSSKLHQTNLRDRGQGEQLPSGDGIYAENSIGSDNSRGSEDLAAGNNPLDSGDRSVQGSSQSDSVDHGSVLENSNDQYAHRSATAEGHVEDDVLSGDSLYGGWRHATNGSDQHIVEDLIDPGDYWKLSGEAFQKARAQNEQYKERSQLSYRLQANLDAVRAIIEFNNSDRTELTDDEITALTQYTGFGGFSPDVLDEHRDLFIDEYGMSESNFTSLKDTCLDAFYTPTQIIDAVYKKLQEAGFKSGKILEPSCGTGKFIGRKPEALTDVKFTGIELDPLTANIAQLLYPNQDIRNTGFEETVAENVYDAVIGNVPFGTLRVFDKTDEKLSGNLIHDYFFLKSIKQLRPKGIAALVTSSGTLDKESIKTRKEIFKKADFIGAVRLPTSAFGSSNTDVSTDLIFLQKRSRELTDAEVEELINVNDPSTTWLSTGIYCTRQDNKGETVDVKCNQYFLDNENKVVCSDKGLKPISNQFGDFKCVAKPEQKDFSPEQVEKINECLSFIKMPSMERDLEAEKTNNITFKEEREANLDPKFVQARNYSYFINSNDQVAFKTTEYEKASVLTFGKTKTAKEKQVYMKGLIAIRDCIQHLHSLEAQNSSSQEIDNERKTLRSLYQDFIRNCQIPNGNIKNGLGKKFEDLQNPSRLIYALQVINAYVKNDGSLTACLACEKIKNVEVIQEGKILTESDIHYTHHDYSQVKNAQDALAISLNVKGKVDISFMAKLLNTSDYGAIVKELDKRIYRDPAFIQIDENKKVIPYSGYVTADAYLSGNIYKKIDECEKAVSKFGIHGEIFKAQIDDLKDHIPPLIGKGEINFSFGDRWIKPEYYSQFVKHLLGANLTGSYQLNNLTNEYDYYNRYGNIGKESDFKYIHNSVSTDVYGTKDFPAESLIHKMLNHKEIAVYEEQPYIDKYGNPKTKRAVSIDKTAVLEVKCNAIREEFKKWLFADQKRSDDLVATYNRKFNAYANREYDGEQLCSFDGMNNEITLKSHQKNAIARSLLGGNALFAHEVGAGKTFEMCASIMEKIRLGLAHKAIIVTPVAAQFEQEFLRLYPSAKLLVGRSGVNIGAGKYDTFYSNAAHGDYDAIILTPNQFKAIHLSPEYEKEILEKEIAQYERALHLAEAKDGKNSFNSKKVQELVKNAKTRYANCIAQIYGKDKQTKKLKKAECSVYFEDLGIDALYVDEAHLYKGIPIATALYSKAIHNSSGRAIDMLYKCDYLNDKYDNNAVVLATGTPLSNSILDFYTMQRFANMRTLKEIGVDNFDLFASAYCDSVTKPEIDQSGLFALKTRFATFKNIPEAINVFSQFADIKTHDDIKQYLTLPDVDDFIVECEPTEEQLDKMAEVRYRTLALKQGLTKDQDHYFKISNTAKKLSLDVRLLDENLIDDQTSKVNKCVENVLKIYKEYPTENQIIFCDGSTCQTKEEKQKQGILFNVYDDIRDKLVEKGGLKPSEIAFVQEYKLDDREKLMEKVRSGEVKILIGSSSTVGTGVNCQDHLIAAHHLDSGWKPSDRKQRNGRIIRQGNNNKRVKIFSYVTKGTYDAFMYQTVLRKEESFDKILKKDMSVRQIEAEENGNNISTADLLGASLEDSFVKEFYNLQSDFNKLNGIRNQYYSSLEENKAKVSNLKARKESYSKNLQALEIDQQLFNENEKVFHDPKSFSISLGARVEDRATITDKTEAAKKMMELAKNCQAGGSIIIGNLGGFTLEIEMQIMRVQSEGNIEVRVPKYTLLAYNAHNPANPLAASIDFGFKAQSNNLGRIIKILGELNLKINNQKIKISEFEKDIDTAEKWLADNKEFKREEEFKTLENKFADVKRRFNKETELANQRSQERIQNRALKNVIIDFFTSKCQFERNDSYHLADLVFESTDLSGNRELNDYFNNVRNKTIAFHTRLNDEAYRCPTFNDLKPDLEDINARLKEIKLEPLEFSFNPEDNSVQINSSKFDDLRKEYGLKNHKNIVKQENYVKSQNIAVSHITEDESEEYDIDIIEDSENSLPEQNNEIKQEQIKDTPLDIDPTVIYASKNNIAFEHISDILEYVKENKDSYRDVLGNSISVDEQSNLHFSLYIQVPNYDDSLKSIIADFTFNNTGKIIEVKDHDQIYGNELTEYLVGCSQESLQKEMAELIDKRQTENKNNTPAKLYSETIKEMESVAFDNNTQGYFDPLVLNQEQKDSLAQDPLAQSNLFKFAENAAYYYGSNVRAVTDLTGCPPKIVNNHTIEAIYSLRGQITKASIHGVNGKFTDIQNEKLSVDEFKKLKEERLALYPGYAKQLAQNNNLSNFENNDFILLKDDKTDVILKSDYSLEVTDQSINNVEKDYFDNYCTHFDDAVKFYLKNPELAIECSDRYIRFNQRSFHERHITTYMYDFKNERLCGYPIENANSTFGNDQLDYVSIEDYKKEKFIKSLNFDKLNLDLYEADPINIIYSKHYHKAVIELSCHLKARPQGEDIYLKGKLKMSHDELKVLNDDNLSSFFKLYEVQINGANFKKSTHLELLIRNSFEEQFESNEHKEMIKDFLSCFKDELQNIKEQIYKKIDEVKQEQSESASLSL